MEDQARLMAERIARRMSAGSATPQTDISSELAAVRASLDDLQNRLVQIEAKVSGPRVHSPWHPSLDRFGVEEATVSELVDFFQNEKACSMEPGGKPCDHCAMCSSRGF
jgi:CRISPR/Cas system-associated protein Cas10 (large subunit of type III CRISPR-Cas system)